MEKFKFLQNLHTHTEFCDGENTAEEMVEQAIKLGFKSLGFSGHGVLGEFSSYSLTPEKTILYRQEIQRLKQKYKGIIDIFMGIEFDYYTLDDPNIYEYVIGSVHYYKPNENEVYALDIKSPDKLKSTIENVFEGDPLKLAETYYKLVADLPNKLGKIDMVGHFDLLLKSNDRDNLIDTSSKKYREIVNETLRTLIKKVQVFEINTGAIARGVKKVPYPEDWVLKEIKAIGGKVLLNSDCHIAEKMTCWFDEGLELVKNCGFNEVQYFDGKQFIPLKI